MAAVTKSQLAIILSKLKLFTDPKVSLEQYPTDSEIAADLCWNAYMLGDIEDKRVFDLGCGTGILGIASLILGAKSMTGIDVDKESVTLAEQNLEKVRLDGYAKEGEAALIVRDIMKFKGWGDTVIQNPPFGTREEHADREFLDKGFELAHTVYSIHKTSTGEFVERHSDRNGFKVTHKWNYRFPIKRSYSHHKKDLQRIDATAFRIQKK